MMKEQPSAVSPFAALDTRSKMEQWIWWQCQHPQDEPVSLAQSLPESQRTLRRERRFRRASPRPCPSTTGSMTR